MASWNQQFRPSQYEQIESQLALLRSKGDAASSTSAILQLFQACATRAQRVLDHLRSTRPHPGLLHLQPYLPGAKKFICLQDNCTNHCCKKPSQLIETYPQAERAIQTKTGLPLVDFITHDNGRRFLHKDSVTHACVFLDDHDACKVQDVKPYGCRLYPFVIALFDLHEDGSLTYYPSGRVIHRTLQGRAVRCFDSKLTQPYHFLVPLLLHYTDCPGFIGDAISFSEYLHLAEECFSDSWQWWSAELESAS